MEPQILSMKIFDSSTINHFCASFQMLIKPDFRCLAPPNDRTNRAVDILKMHKNIGFWPQMGRTTDSHHSADPKLMTMTTPRTRCGKLESFKPE